MHVYLSSGFYSENVHKFKAIAKKAITAAGGTFYDPEDFEGMPCEYVKKDLDQIRKATVVLAYQDNYPKIFGTAAEIGFAAGIGVPVIYICQADRINLFLAGLSKGAFTSIEDAVATMVSWFKDK